MEEKLKLCLGCLERKDYDGPCQYCGYSEDTPHLPSYLAPGSVLNDRYLVGRLLRYNGESATYLAYDAVMQRKIWIKEYMPDTLCARVKGSSLISVNQQNLAPYKTFMSEFTELNKLLSKMRTLSHINPALELFAENNTTYVTFDVIEGITLKEYLQQNAGELSWDEVKSLFPPIFTTISLVHNAGIIHRGISPDTIWITDSGELKISDFCITASRTNNTELAPELFAGYAAPEQYASSNWQGTWTDVYGICAVLYRILTGCMPTEAVSRVGNDNLCEPSSVNKNIPANVSKVIMSGLTLSGDMRIQTVTELVTKLFEQPGYLEPSAGRTATIAIPRQAVNQAQARHGAPPKKSGRKKKKASNMRIPIIVFVVTVTILLMLSLGLMKWVDNTGPSENYNTTPQYTQSTQPTLVETTIETTRPFVESYEMPNFVGKNFELIQNSPTYKGWLTFVPSYVYDDENEKDIIIEQSIPEKTSVQAGVSVQIKISLGPSTIEIPDHIGLTEKEYIAILDKAGIKYEILRQPDTGFMSGYVIRTEHSGEDNKIDVENGEILKVFVCDNGNSETSNEQEFGMNF